MLPLHTFPARAPSGIVSTTFAAPAGDIDGDGATDFIIRTLEDAAAGDRVQVFSGATGMSLHTFTGQPGTQFGVSVAGAGDTDNDGTPDVIIGVADSQAFPLTGSAHVYSGASGALLASFASNDISNPIGDQFGLVVGPAGDINNDGHADVFISAPSNDDLGSSAGAVFIYSGATGAELARYDGDGVFDLFGSAAANAGDLNGDDIDDLLVNSSLRSNKANPDRGDITALSGADGSSLLVVDSTPAEPLFAFSINPAGDVNNDGTPDIIAGGNVLVRVLSSDTGATIRSFPVDGIDLDGVTVNAAGDIDNDGFDDVLVGESESRPRGVVRVFSGQSGEALVTLEGVPFDERFGRAVAPAGDINGDGLDDIFIAAGPENTAGSATVYLTTVVDVGAACFPDGSCIDALTASEAAAIGGAYQGNGTRCDTAGCVQPTGACCNTQTGDCTVLTRSQCDALADGVWNGADSICDADGDGIPDGLCNINCPADTNGDGLVTPADFNAWIFAFINQSPACDQNGDGACTPADFNAWILNFNTGC